MTSPPATPRAAAAVAVLRVPQWVKNLLIFVPMILDHRILEPAYLLKAAAAFSAFSAAASGAYVLNDVLDVQVDRQHPVKRRRPFAAGTLPPAFGLIVTPALFAVALTVAVAALPPRFAALLVVYVVVTTAYSVHLKRIAVLDVLILAGLYTIRVLAGVAATEVPFSTWLLVFSMFLFLSLAFLKRYTELRRVLAGEGDSMGRRGYLGADQQWIGMMGAASGYLSVLVLALYVNSDQVVRLYHEPAWLLLVCPLLLYWISRMWLLAHRGAIDDDPIVVAVRDPMSYVVGALVVVVLVVAL